jgi:hypothetical protein
MRTRFDQFGKQMVRDALAPRGPVETDAEVPADTRRIDLWFMPDSMRIAGADELGLLGRIASGPTTLEFFHRTPSGEDLASCLIKHGAFRHLLSLRKPPPQVPTQWVISSGRPERGIDGLWLRPIATWPSGIYEAPPLLWTRLVVVNELPVDRATLLLRLLGAGAVLAQAIAELKTLQAEAPERALALPILLRLRLGVPDDPARQTTDDQEFLMTTQDIVETWRREAIQEGVKQGLQEGVKQGLQEGVKQGLQEGVKQGLQEGVKQGLQEGVKQGLQEGVKQGLERGVATSLIDVYEARFGTIPADLHTIVEDTHDEPTLRAWLRIAGTGSADDIAAEIRASRGS